MVFYLCLCLFLTLFYLVMMSLYRYYWVQTEEFQIEETEMTLPTVTVVIPARNEAENIGALLQDLINQNYPKNLLEIIVVDDHSDDDTVRIAESFSEEQVKVLQLSQILTGTEVKNAYKKKAIEIGVQCSESELIITTDGDCRVPREWVRTMVGIKNKSHAKLLTGAVIMRGTNTAFRKFQSLDFLGMMGITAAMLKMRIYNMANGANLLYEKKAFEEVGGFKGIDHLSSGDDMLLMHKIAAKHNGEVAYAKHPQAVVYTQTESTLSAFLQQRFRWTAKSKDYQDKKMTWILGFVFLFVFSLLANAFGALFSMAIFKLFLFQLSVKIVVDYRLLKSTSAYYSKGELMHSFPLSQVFHILYIVFVGSFGNILNFEWKGRKQKK